MKHYYFLLISILFMVGCKPKYTEVIQSLHPDGLKQFVNYYKITSKDSSLVMMREFYPTSEKIRIEGTYKDNKRDGMWKSWRQNGDLWSEGEFKNGQRNGITKTYHDNGKLYYSGYYKDNERTGKWVFFNEQGQKVKEENY